MRKVAFLIPIYPPHFAYANLFIKSFKKFGYQKQADLWFIFTNEEEKEQFGEWKNSIILPPELRIFENRGIINIKKFYGLSQIKDKYDYIIILDSESKLIKKENLYNVCEDFYSQKILYSNSIIKEEFTIDIVNKIYSTCCEYFPSFRETLRNYDKDYLWFNNLCIYKTQILKDFFEYTQLDCDKNLIKLTFYDFDYYIYMYYLLLFENFKITDLECYARFGVLESYDFIPKIHSTMYRDFKPYHCNPKIYNKINHKRVFVYIQTNVGNWYTNANKNIKNRIILFLISLIPVKKIRKELRNNFVYRTEV